MLQPQMSPPAPIPVAFLNTRGVIQSLLNSFGFIQNILNMRGAHETLFDHRGGVPIFVALHPMIWAPRRIHTHALSTEEPIGPQNGLHFLCPKAPAPHKRLFVGVSRARSWSRLPLLEPFCAKYCQKLTILSEIDF